MAPTAPPATSGPNVLLIVVDTLRADRLGCYGHPRPTSPAIDALAARGVRFERAYSAAPWTMPSVASILTGLHPTSHGANHYTRSLAADVERLPGLLRDAGYRTGAIVSGYLIGERYGFAPGFDRFVDSEAKGQEHLSTPGVTETAIALVDELSSSDAPFFVLAHYFDPHEDYRRHPEFGFAGASGGRLDGSEPARALRKLDDVDEDEVQLILDIYDEEIRFTDDGIGRLLDHLRERGLHDETLVLLTADHGEEFWEHGWLGHVTSLRDDLMRVPLIIAGPNVNAGRIVDRPVSLVSITPTVLDALGLEVDAQFEARSFTGDLIAERASPTTDPVFLEVEMGEWKGGPDTFLHGIVDERYKLVRNPRNGQTELFDLDADPDERSDVSDKRSDLVERYRSALDSHRTRVEAGRRRSPERAPNAAELDRLSGLGYAGDDR